ncbi:MAG: cytochrome c [Acidimicrobiia bacterium]|nr:cytochrome c [Acidimicrobiia bacterium]
MATLGPIRAARFRPVFLLALAWPLLAAACGGADVPQVPADDAQLVTGRMVYANNCAPCHGANGGGGVGAKLNGGKLVEQIPDPTDQRLLVENGRNQMPAFSQKLSSEEIAAVVRYTREIINEQ